MSLHSRIKGNNLSFGKKNFVIIYVKFDFFQVAIRSWDPFHISFDLLRNES